MINKKNINRDMFGRKSFAVLLSLTIHIFIFVTGQFLLNRREIHEKESPRPIKIQLLPKQNDIHSNSNISNNQFDESNVNEPSATPSISTDSGQNSITKEKTNNNELHTNEQESVDVASYNENVVPPWEIDVPPTLLLPGNIGSEQDNTSLLDALPLIASIYLDESGTPFLIIYDPIPNNEALRRLNTFFSTSVFSPAMVENQSVPSVLNIPLSIKGFS